MRCPHCESLEDKVLESRTMFNGDVIRRRRECLSCKCRFTTYEVVENTPLMVVKKDHSIEPFDPEKLVERLRRAAVKRPLSLAELEGMVDEIENELKNKLIKEVPSSKIGEMVLEKLKDKDDVAYIRFASVYMDFTDAESFIKIITELK